MPLKYWTEEELKRARAKGEEMAAWFEANEAPCLHGCLCARCGGDAAKQAPSPEQKGFEQ